MPAARDLAEVIANRKKQQRERAERERDERRSQVRDTKGDQDRRRRPTPPQNKQAAARTVRAIADETVKLSRETNRRVGKPKVQEKKRSANPVLRVAQEAADVAPRVLDLVYGDGDDDGRKRDKGSRAASGVAPRLGAPTIGGGDAITRRLRNLAIATAQDPDDVALSTARSVPQIAQGVASLVASVAHDTARGKTDTLRSLPGAAVDDYKRRYGADDKEQRRQFKQEGVLPEVLDATAVAAPTGAVVGRALTPVARTGKLGATAKRATESRPLLRVTAGEQGAREQNRSPNLLRALTQDRKDARRTKATERRSREAREEGGTFRGLTPKQGEVVHRTLPAQNRAQRKALADRTGRAAVQLRAKQDTEIRKGVEKNLKSLDRRERRAFAYTLSLGLPADPQKAAAALARHREQIVAERSARGTPKPKGNQADELVVIDRILAAPERHFTARVRAAADTERARGQRVAREDPSFTEQTARAREVMDQGALLGIRRPDDDATPDDVEAYIAAVERAAADAGLAPGGYFPAQPRPQGVFSARAAGAGNRAVAGAKRTTGVLAATGRRDTDPAQLATAQATNIKRGENWKMVTDAWEENSPAWGRNKPIEVLRRQIDARRLDPQDWVIVDMGRFRERARANKDASDVNDDGTSNKLHDAVVANTHDFDGNPAIFKGTGGRFSLVSKAVADEMEAGAKPSGAAARTIGKVQGQTSRILLHTNPTFVPVQAISNAALVAAQAPMAIVRAFRAQAWYRGLEPMARMEVDTWIGVSPARDAGMASRYGASPDSNLGRAWAAFVDNPKVKWWEGSAMNPLTWNPYLDSKQNAAFRKAVLYDTIRKERARAIGKDARALRRDVKPLMDVLAMPDGPDKVAALRAAEPQFAKAGERVDRILGNYTRYTVKERRMLKRGLLFYGFLRWSVQFTFRTLPVQHPVASSIAAKLGQLQREEIVDLLADEAAAKGIGPKEDVQRLLRAGHLPFVFGRVWLTKDGNLESIDITRANPMLNPIMDAFEDPFRAGAGLISPIVQSALDVAFGKSLFKQQDLRDSDNQPLAGTDRARYMVGQTMRLAAPFRMAEKVTQESQQGDEAIPLLAPAPKEPSSPDAIARAQQRTDERVSDTETLLDQLMPLVRSKRDGWQRGVAAALDDERKRAKKKKPKKGPRTAEQRAADASALPEAGGSTLSQAQVDAIFGGGK